MQLQYYICTSGEWHYIFVFLHHFIVLKSRHGKNIKSCQTSRCDRNIRVVIKMISIKQIVTVTHPTTEIGSNKQQNSKISNKYLLSTHLHPDRKALI